MNGFLYGGIADGFLRGLAASRGLMLQDEELERQKQQDIKSDARFNEEMKFRKDEASRQAEHQQAQMDLYREGLGLKQKEQESEIDFNKQKLANDKLVTEKQLKALSASSARDEERFKLQQAEEARAKEKDSWQIMKEKRLLAREQLPAVYQMVQSGEPLTPEAYKVIHDSAGFDPYAALVEGKANKILQTVEAVRSGKMDMHDQKVGEALDFTFGAALKRGIGEELQMNGKDNQGNIIPAGAKIQKKRFLGMVESQEKPGFYGFAVRVTAEKDGKTYEYDAPITVRGTTSADDPMFLVRGDELEKPFAAMALMNSDENLRKALENYQNSAVSPKDQSIIDKNKSVAKKYDEEAALIKRGGKDSQNKKKFVPRWTKDQKGQDMQVIEAIDPVTLESTRINTQEEYQPPVDDEGEKTSEEKADTYLSSGKPTVWKKKSDKQ